MAGGHDIGHGQDALAVADDGLLVGAKRIDLRRSVGVPPQVGQGMDPVVGADDQGCVLLGVTGRQPELRVRTERIAVAVMVEPQVVLVTGPEVDHLGVWKQPDVDCVVGMVVTEKDVGHRFGCHAEGSQRIEDQRAPGHHPGVGNDERVAVADEGDAAADALGRVAGMEKMHGCHECDGTHSWTVRRPVADGEPSGTPKAGAVASSAPPLPDRCHRRSCLVPSVPVADLVLRGGGVHTVDPARPSATAVAVGGGRIVAVGDDGDVAALIGSATRVIELRGRTLLPGFQDAHCHPISSGLDQLRCDLLGVTSGRAAVLDAIHAYATSHPDDPWIIGSGWYMADFPNGTPHRRDLDAAVGDRPAYLENRDGHSGWVSSRTLALAGIDASTADPVGGRIERDPDGTPTGALHESAVELVEPFFPPTTQADLERGLLRAQAYFHSLGITAWQDAHVEPADEATYLAVANRGQLTMRTIGAQWWEPSWDVAAIPDLVARRVSARADRYASTSIKMMLDGVLETFTGAMLEPYLAPDGGSADRTGILFIEPEVVRRIVVELDRNGFQVHFHVIGDRAARIALDALEAALAVNGRTDGRHHLAHIQVIHPDDVPRFAALGAIANAQPLWACHERQMDLLTIPFLGPERTGWQYPFGSLVRSGARLAMGSDWAVSTPNPFEEMHVAVERVHHTLVGKMEPLLPDEALTLDQAVHAFTMGSAYVNHLDDTTGSISVGKLADLAVLDRDLWDRGAGSIAAARVVGTFVEGKAVHEDPSLGG